VENRRFRLGIPPFDPGWKFWTAEEDRLLGTASDAIIAGQLGRSESSVQSRRLKLGIPWVNPARRNWTGDELQLLGTLPDAVLAEKFQRTEKAILSKRLALRIPKPQSPPSRAEPPPEG